MTRLPRFPRVRATAAVLAASLAGSLAGACATTAPEEPAAPASGGAAPGAADPADVPAPPAPAVTVVTPPADDFEFGRTLQATDKRVDEFVWLGTQPGEEARTRRDLARSALEAVVAQNREKFVAAASDRSEPTRRRIAAKALAFSDDPRATKLLADALATTDDTLLQTNSAFALARRRDPDTPLDTVLAGAASPDADVRVNSLLALWHVLDARAEAGRPADGPTRDRVLPVLEGALFDPDDPMARGHAAAAMGALGDPRGVDPLLNLLRDGHPAVRTHVALALGKLGDRRAIRPLVEQIDDTPRGTPRGAVLLGISLLLEREGIAVPADMPDDERVWSGFVQRVAPARGPDRR